MFNTLE